MTELTVEKVFATRAEQRAETEPVAAAVWKTLAAEPGLVAAIAGDAEPGWALPHRLMAVLSETLRTAAADHRLAAYWATLGGDREPDDELPGAVRDLVDVHAEKLRRSWSAGRDNRQNDPQAAAIFRAALDHVNDGRDMALIEMGGTAGLALLPDRYGIDYGAARTGAGRVPVLECEIRGDGIEGPRGDLTVSRRIGVELDPVRRNDAAGVAWLRDCVEPDAVDRLERIDRALDHREALESIDWRAGDYFDELPGALASVGDDELAVVFGANTLCCAERPERLPDLLAASGRDLVWISKEHPANGLGLVSPAGRRDADDNPIILTAVTYRAGRLDDATILGTVDPYNAWIDWAPEKVETD